MLNSFQQHISAERKLDVNSMEQGNEGSAFSATCYEAYVQCGWQRGRSPNAAIRKILSPPFNKLYCRKNNNKLSQLKSKNNVKYLFY